MPPTPAAPPAWLPTWMSAGAALFFLLMLSMPSGYSGGGGAPPLGGLAVWWTGPRAGHAHWADTPGGQAPAPWTTEDRTLCALLLAVFAINVLAVLWHGDLGKYLDQGVRYLLALPIPGGTAACPAAPGLAGGGTGAGPVRHGGCRRMADDRHRLRTRRGLCHQRHSVCRHSAHNGVL